MCIPMIPWLQLLITVFGSIRVFDNLVTTLWPGCMYLLHGCLGCILQPCHNHVTIFVDKVVATLNKLHISAWSEESDYMPRSLSPPLMPSPLSASVERRVQCRTILCKTVVRTYIFCKVGILESIALPPQPWWNHAAQAQNPVATQSSISNLT